MKTQTAYIALGSNIEPKLDYLHQAIEKLDAHDSVTVTRESSVYDTAPVGYLDQDNFLNMVVEVQTTLESLELLDLCQKIEGDLKRVRQFKDGPRTIDLDIILYGSDIIESDRLQVPHPRMHIRGFVLFPLAEINGQLLIPQHDQTADNLRDSLPQREKDDVKILGELAELRGEN